MKRFEIAFDDFGTVRYCMVRSTTAEAAEDEFWELYGYDVVAVREVA